MISTSTDSSAGKETPYNEFRTFMVKIRKDQNLSLPKPKKSKT